MRRSAPLTASIIDALEPGDIVHDSKLPGFGARRQKDAVSYFVKLRHRNRQKWITVGKHGRALSKDEAAALTVGISTPSTNLVWTVDVARQAALRIMADPVAASAGQVTCRLDTVDQVFDTWMERHVTVHLKPSSARVYREYYDAYCRKPLGPLSPLDVDFARVARAHAQLKETPSAANHMIRTLRSMFSWAERNQLLTWQHGNPTRGHRLYRETPRDRILSVEEIRTFLSALPQAAMDESTRRALTLELLLGQRSGEVVGMRKAHVDLTAATWTILRNKSDRPHVVPLPPWSRELIAAAMKDAVGPCLFPSPVGDPTDTDAVAIEPHALSKALTRAQRPVDDAGAPVRKTPEADWVFDFRDRANEPNPITPHDLRRTCASYLELLGFGDFIRSAILNHSQSRNVTAKHYSAADLLKLKRTALLHWEAAVRQIMAGHNPFAVALDSDRAEEERVLGKAVTIFNAG